MECGTSFFTGSRRGAELLGVQIGGFRIFFKMGGPDFFAPLDAFINYVMGELCSFTGVGAEFLPHGQRGPEFFPIDQGGTRIFFTHAKGGPKKN